MVCTTLIFIVANGSHICCCGSRQSLSFVVCKQVLLVLGQAFKEEERVITGSYWFFLFHTVRSSADFFLMNPGVQPYLSSPHLKSIGNSSTPPGIPQPGSPATSACLGMCQALMWTERLKDKQSSPPTRFLHCAASQIKKSYNSSTLRNLISEAKMKLLQLPVATFLLT